MAGIAGLITGGVIGCTILFFFWRAVWRASGHVFDEMRVASAPVPTPQQIAVALEEEWDRPPTVEEVAAVHQMLMSRHNQALTTSLAGVGALYLLGHY